VPRNFPTSIWAYRTTGTVSIAQGGHAMLRFQTPLTAAAREMLVYCLQVAADETVELDEDHDAWAAAYPLASACFTPESARRVLLELLEKLDDPELYALTDYHWLLVYECLKEQIALFDDGPVPSLGTRLRALASDPDAGYLHLPTRSSGTADVWIDFDEFIDAYFWDTDFLTDVGVFGRLTPTPSHNSGTVERSSGSRRGSPRIRTSLS
jgi:hypothetical protein